MNLVQIRNRGQKFILIPENDKKAVGKKSNAFFEIPFSCFDKNREL